MNRQMLKMTKALVGEILVGCLIPRTSTKHLMSQAARIQALSIGHALERESARSGVVHSVFARAVNLMVPEEMWTLLAAEKADLPFGIRIASSQLDVLGFSNGDPVNFRAGFLSIGSGSTCRVVDCRAAPRWLPTRHNEIEPGLAGRLAVVATAASGRSWHESARMAQSVRSALEYSVTLGEDYWKIPANKPSCFVRILHLSLCYLSLWLIASSNSLRCSGMLGEFSSVEIQRWNLLRPEFTLTSGPAALLVEQPLGQIFRRRLLSSMVSPGLMRR